MSDDQSPKTEIKGLQDYLFEANLPPQIQSGQNRIAAESLIEYFVIDKLSWMKSRNGSMQFLWYTTYDKIHKLHQLFFHITQKRLSMSNPRKRWWFGMKCLKHLCKRKLF